MQAFAANPYGFAVHLADATAQIAQDIRAARERLPQVAVSPAAEEAALQLVNQLHIQSLRAEIVLLQSARARAAADERERAGIADVVAVAPMALRLRFSPFIAQYEEARQREDRAIQEAIDVLAITSPTEDG